jgi:hypothetical protein
MRPRVAAHSVVFVLCLASCGGTPSTVAPTTPAATAARPAAVATSEPALDLSPVPAPVGLAVTVHLSHPRTTLQQILSYVGPYAALFNGGAKLDADSIVTLALGAPLASLVDLDQPIDLAASDLDSPGSSYVGSVVLSDPAAARQTLEKFYKWSAVGQSVVHLEPREDAPDGASPRPCALTPSFDARPGAMRLVCGASENAVHHLGAYLTRTMTRLPSTDDLRVEVFVGEFAKETHDQLHDLSARVGPSSDPTGADKDPASRLLDALTDKATHDVGSLVLEASSDGTSVDTRLTSRFVAAASPLTRALLGAGTPSAPPPPAFARLPRDASSAWYGRGAKPADLTPLRALVLESFLSWLQDDGYTASASNTLMAPLQKLLLTGGPWVIASGSKVDAARVALQAYADAGKTTLPARAKARQAMQGWAVGAVEEPPQGWIDGVRELVKSDGVQPTGKPRVKHDPQKESTRLSLAPVPAALQLPAGTLHVEAHITQNQAWLASQQKAKKTGLVPVLPHTVHFFVVPDGARTWFAAAEDAALAASEVRSSLASAGDAGTLATRRDLDAFRAMPASAAGFVSVADLATWAHSDWSDEGLRKARESLLGLASLPDGGSTPIPFALTSVPGPEGAAAGGEARLRFVFPLKVGVDVAASQHSIF